MTFAPFFMYDVSAQQAWLEDQAARGQFLRSHNGLVAAFDKGAPQVVRYRLQPQRSRWDAPDEETQEVYRLRGWHYVATVGGVFRVWRCDDPSAPEVDTEPEVQGESYGYLRRKNRQGNWVVLAICLGMPALVLALNQPITWYWRRQIESNQPGWRVLSLLLMFLALMTQLLWGTRILRRLIRTLRSGIPVARRSPYRLSRCMTALGAGIYVFWLAITAASLFQPSHQSFVPVEEWAEPVPYVALADLDTAEALPVNNWRTTAQWWVLQEGPGEARAESRYYHLRSSWTTERLMEDLRGDEGFSPLDAPGLDEAWLARWPDGGQSLLVRRGRQVLRMHYDGREDLRERMGQYAALFDKFT